MPGDMRLLLWLTMVAGSLAVQNGPEVMKEKVDPRIWLDVASQVAPTLWKFLEKEGLLKSGLLSAMADESVVERLISLRTFLRRTPTEDEGYEWHSLLDSARPHAEVDRSLLVSAVSRPWKRSLPSCPSSELPPLIEVLRSFRHKRGDGGWVPRADRKKPKVSSETAREALIQKIVEFLMSTGLPIVGQLQLSMDAASLARRLGGGLRFSTLKRRFDEGLKLKSWLLHVFGFPWLRNAVQLLDYIIELASEPCAPSRPRMVLCAVSMIERMGGMPSDQCLSRDGTVLSVVKDLEVELKTAAGVRAKKKAHPALLAIIVGLEALVLLVAVPVGLRVYAFWKLLKVWAALRFSDGLHMPPKLCKVTSSAGFSATITRTKTTGPGKKVEVVHAYVSQSCWVAFDSWLDVGWTLFCNLGGGDREFFIPLLNSACDDWALPITEMTYMDACGLSRKVFGMLTSHHAVPGRLGRPNIFVRDEDGVKLFIEGVQVFFAEHGDRAVLPSWISWLRFPKEVADVCGRWSPQGSAEYIRTARQTVLDTQREIAASLRRGTRAKCFGETDTLDILNDFMEVREASAEQVWTQRSRFLVVWPPARSDDSGDEDLGGSSLPEEEEVATPLGNEEASSSSVRGNVQDDSDEEVEVPAGTWVISLSGSGKGRTLHKVGACFRIPGIHYALFETFEEEQVQSASFSKMCRDCFKATIGDSAPAADSQSSDSSSNDSG